MRVANRHVRLFENISMPEAMAKARAYASERPQIGFRHHQHQRRVSMKRKDATPELNLDRMVRSATAGSAGEP